VWTSGLRLEPQKFLDAAARGDLSQVSALLSHTPSLINQTGYSGWTALMLAARNGHHQVVERLLSLGCDKFSANSSSQTAYDVAKFWGHRHIADLLSRSDDQCQRVLPAADLVPQENYFSRETLDRLSAKRTDEVWLEAKRSDPDSVYLLFSNLSPMITVSFCACQMDAKLCRFRYEAVKDLLQKPSTVLIFLGAERKKTPGSSSSSGTEEGEEDVMVSGCVSVLDFPKAWWLRPDRCWRGTAATVSAPRVAAAPGWRRGGTRGAALTPNPVVIMLAVHPDGNQCLLGRKKVFPAGMFSCLAGFVEPGETVEEAVRREVEEESGVKVGPVQYVSCQPWPMPSNLMIGCLAVAISTHIKVDENEIEEARWFPRQQVIESLLRGASQALVLPPRQTIAHQLIRHWISVNSNL
uniref:NAD(+) diphosphatase n=1 Tax=Nothobranchius furzeri TaxID=105023 RepID=A0A8C6PFB5_NOTFU